VHWLGSSALSRSKCLGDGHEYRPFCDLRTVPEADKPREQVENHGRACTQVLCRGNRSKIVEGHVLRSFTFVKQSWDFSLSRNSDRMAGTFRWSEDPSTALAGTFHRRRSRLLKTGFFRQVR